MKPSILCHTLGKTLSDFNQTLFDINQPMTLLPGLLNVIDNHLTIRETAPHLDNLSAHDTMIVVKKEQAVIKTLNDLNTLIHTIPGIIAPWHNIFITCNPGSLYSIWKIHMESASVCPSGQSETLFKKPLEVQCEKLGEKLDLALETSKKWTQTKNWLVWDIIDGQKTPQARFAQAPTPQEALLFDDWTWWCLTASNNRCVTTDDTKTMENS